MRSFKKGRCMINGLSRHHLLILDRRKVLRDPGKLPAAPELLRCQQPLRQRWVIMLYLAVSREGVISAAKGRCVAQSDVHSRRRSAHRDALDPGHPRRNPFPVFPHCPCVLNWHTDSSLGAAQHSQTQLTAELNTRNADVARHLCAHMTVSNSSVALCAPVLQPSRSVHSAAIATP